MTKYRLAIPLVPLVLALGGCAMMEGAMTTSSSPSAEGTAVGSAPSPFMRATLQPFSLANCAKFEALPQECEAALLRGY